MELLGRQVAGAVAHVAVDEQPRGGDAMAASAQGGAQLGVELAVRQGRHDAQSSSLSEGSLICNYSK
jgi:hypothetical protein